MGPDDGRLLALLHADLFDRGFEAIKNGLSSADLSTATEIPPGRTEILISQRNGGVFDVKSGRVYLNAVGMQLAQVLGLIPDEAEAAARSMAKHLRHSIDFQKPISYSELKAATDLGDAALQYVLCYFWKLFHWLDFPEDLSRWDGNIQVSQGAAYTLSERATSAPLLQHEQNEKGQRQLVDSLERLSLLRKGKLVVKPSSPPNPPNAKAPIKQASKPRPDGKTFGKWQVSGGKQPKSGGQGQVLRVECNGMHGVLKKLTGPRANDAKAKRRLLREIVILRRLDHPFIVRVLDAKTSEDEPWIVTEWAPLGSLQTHLASLRGDLHRCTRLIRDVALGLGAAHSQRIIHRDVKPQNILLMEIDRPRIPLCQHSVRQNCSNLL